MTEQQFYSSLKVLGTDTKALQRNAAKLVQYAQHNKQDKFKALFAKVELDFKYVKTLYETVQNAAYWHKDKLDTQEWDLFLKEFDGLFSKIETVITNINTRNEVTANGNG